MPQVCVLHVDAALMTSFVDDGPAGLLMTVRTYKAALAAAARAHSSNTEVSRPRDNLLERSRAPPCRPLTRASSSRLTVCCRWLSGYARRPSASSSRQRGYSSS